MSDDRHTISAGGLSATVLAAGAELCSLRDAAGAEYVWQAGPAWPRHAPWLFPIVGRLAGDTLRHAGAAHRLTQHGFARDRTFAWVERGDASCRLALVDDDATRAMYPFAFRLEIEYSLAADALRITVTLHNPGAAPLPAAIGWHPAFAWPLRPGLAKTAHALHFERPEPAPLRRVSGGLLLEGTFPSPIEGDRLALREDLFAADALILDPVASRSVRYAAPGGPTLTVAWENCPQLGLWTRPPGGAEPADFLCIEPWHGYASPAGFDGEFTEKPGLLHVAAGSEAMVGFSVRVAGVG